MKVTATRPTWVNATGGKTLLKKDQSAEVDGRQYRNHPFVAAGYLVVEEEPKPKRKPKAEPAPEADDAEADGGES
jgi:hypothetical protein